MQKPGLFYFFAVMVKWGTDPISINRKAVENFKSFEMNTCRKQKFDKITFLLYKRNVKIIGLHNRRSVFAIP